MPGRARCRIGRRAVPLPSDNNVLITSSEGHHGGAAARVRVHGGVGTRDGARCVRVACMPGGPPGLRLASESSPLLSDVSRDVHPGVHPGSCFQGCLPWSCRRSPAGPMTETRTSRTGRPSCAGKKLPPSSPIPRTNVHCRRHSQC
jgi:hypothetical protein